MSANRQGIHVTTFVTYPKENLEQADVAAESFLVNPGGDGEAGDAVKAVLQKTENYQCQKGKGTNNCEQVHAYAEDRVVARLQKDDKIAVTWREFHPLVAKGHATSEKEFVAKKDGRTVKVVAQAVFDGDEAALEKEGKLGLVGMRNLQVELNKLKECTEFRQQVRAQRDVFTIQIENAHVSLDALATKYQDLPGQKKIKATLDGARDELAALLDDAWNTSLSLLPNADAQSPVAMQQHLHDLTPKVSAALLDAEEIEQQHAQLIALQASIRPVIDGAETLLTKVSEAENKYSKWTVIIDVASLKKELNALLRKTKKDSALANLETLQAEGIGAQETLTQLEDAFDAAMGNIAQDVAKFEERVDMVRQWQDGRGAKELVDYMSDGGEIAGFALPYWSAQAKKTAAAIKKTVAKIKVANLDYGKATDSKSIDGALDKILSIYTPFVDRVSADMNKRAGKIFEPITASGNTQFVAPSVAFTVSGLDDGKMDANFVIRNNDTQALLLKINTQVNGQSTTIKTVFLTAKGQRLEWKAEDIDNAVEIEVSAVGELDEADQVFNLTGVSARSPVLSAAKDGASRRFLPSWFKVTEQHENENTRVSGPSYDSDDVRSSIRRLPGDR